MSWSGQSRFCMVVAVAAVMLAGVFWSGPASARIQGNCGDCHTMHNSQGGNPMTFDTDAAPNNNLLRGTCLGCHAQGGSSATVNLGTDKMPQVMHTDGVDLAGGNFAYITGLKGSGASDSKGHNISPLTGADAVLYAPPGGIIQFGHNDGLNVNTDNLSCAGTNGCHGYRYSSKGEGIGGSHHRNVDGQIANPTEPADSYRFLMGVKGYESGDWEESVSSSSHNEYFGLTAPVALGCSNATSCHTSDGAGVAPPDGTMSQFCATCHGNFHTVATSSSDGIGTDTMSPFIRHPTDLALPATGEYAQYTVYDPASPVARTGSVPAVPNGTVSPGSDAVMCLSCHVAHASNYSSMLRWDYGQMVAGGGQTATAGCFACHTTKD